MEPQRSAEEAFSRNYATDHWSGGSGVGSRDDLNEGYRGLVQRLVSSSDVRSVVDAGCGDWQFSRNIDWSGVDYRGFDVVDDVIATNRTHFSKKNVSFDILDFSRKPLPKADLLLCKDVLQHWPLTNIETFLEHNLKRFRYVLITNDVASVHCSASQLNSEIEFGQWRTLDLEKSPFSLPVRKAVEFDYMNQWTKRSVLVCSRLRQAIARRSPKSALNRFDASDH